MNRNTFYSSTMSYNKHLNNFFSEKLGPSSSRTRAILRPRVVAAFLLVALVVLFALPHNESNPDSTIRTTKSTKSSPERPGSKSGTFDLPTVTTGRDAIDLGNSLTERYGSDFAAELRNVFAPERRRVPAARLDRKTGITPWILPNDDDLWIPEDGKLIPFGSFEAKPSFRPAVCFVARTYYKHDPRTAIDSVDKFIASLMLQRFPLWQLVLLDTGAVKSPDVPEFDYLHTKVKHFADQHEPQRIKIVSIDSLPTPPEEYRYTPRTNANETEDTHLFHTHLYWLTDYLIRTQCHPDTQFVVATNGDNWYHPEFITSLLETNEKWVQLQRDNGIYPIESLDVISVDLYSRWAFSWAATDGMASPRQLGCKLFQTSAPGMANHQRVFRTDLGANAFRYRKLVEEYKFVHNVTCGELAGHDGCFFETIKQWKRKTIDLCLYSHGPNAFQCTLYGGVMSTLGQGSARFQCAHSPEEFTRPSKLFEGASSTNGAANLALDGRCYEQEPTEEDDEKESSRRRH